MNQERHKSSVLYTCGVFCLGVMCFCSGCALVGLAGTPTRREEKVPAEYDLARHADSRTLVLVEQPAGLNVRANVRHNLTSHINRQLIEKVELPAQGLVPYEELADFRSARSDFSLLSPIEIAGALNADVVLFVAIEDCRFKKIDITDYFKASLVTQCVLWQVADGKRLWPEAADGKTVAVAFEIGPQGRLAAVDKLALSMAYCIVRYFYDCPEDRFKIADDRTDSQWRNW